VARESDGGGRIRRLVIAEEVAARIEELIASGKLAVGDKLPPERELARELHISRPTLREGIRALSATGTVRVEHGKGSFVARHPSQAGRVTADGLAAPFPRAVRSRLRALLFAAAAARCRAGPGAWRQGPGRRLRRGLQRPDGKGRLIEAVTLRRASSSCVRPVPRSSSASVRWCGG